MAWKDAHLNDTQPDMLAFICKHKNLQLYQSLSMAMNASISTTKMSNCVSGLRASDILVYVGLLILFFGLLYALMRTRPARAWLKLPRMAPLYILFAGTHHQMKDNLGEIAAYHSITKEQDAQIVALTKQETDLQNKLSEALSHTQQAVEVAVDEATNVAAKDMAQNDEQIKKITNDCRRALDPERVFHVHLDISTLAMFVKNYGVKREQALKELERREKSLGGGQIVQELKDAKARASILARQVTMEKQEMKEQMALLSSENIAQKSSIQGLNEQVDELKEIKTDQLRVLALTREDLRQ